jgi:hypothetical protein
VTTTARSAPPTAWRPVSVAATDSSVRPCSAWRTATRQRLLLTAELSAVLRNSAAATAQDVPDHTMTADLVKGLTRLRTHVRQTVTTCTDRTAT